MEHNIKKLLELLSEDRIKEIFLSSLTFHNSCSDKTAQEIMFDEKIDWNNVKVQFDKNKYLKTAQDSILSIIEIFESVNDQLLPEIFDQIIISNCSLALLAIKSKTNHSDRCIYIDMMNFRDNLDKEIKRNKIDIAPIVVIGSLIIMGYLLIMT